MTIKKLKYYSVEEAAKIMDKSIWAVRRWVRIKYIKAHKVGREYRIYEGEIKRVLGEDD